MAIVREGGRVLIPIVAIGKAQERGGSGVPVVWGGFGGWEAAQWEHCIGPGSIAEL